MWEIEVRHTGLNKYRNIRGSDKHVVQQKAIAQELAWEEMWEKRQAVEERRQAREAAIQNKEEKKDLAAERSEEASRTLSDLENTLKYTLEVDDTINWASLLDKRPFSTKPPSEPIFKMVPKEPHKDDEKYQPNFTLWDNIFSSSKKKKIKESNDLYQADMDSWVDEKNKIRASNENLESIYQTDLAQWTDEKNKYHACQHINNEAINKKKSEYMNKEPGAVSDYCEMVLSNSVYPDFFPQEWDLDYQVHSRILIVDYSLPDIDSIPTLKGVKYVASRDEFTESHISATVLNKLYDDLLYQISLRTIHELYEADVVDALGSIVFNGWVDAIDRSTGLNANSCIMSIQASKDEFLAINLERIEPKACFKQLKGVGSAKLHGLTPVAPIININKEDRRFTSAYEVVDKIESGDNLAAMDWQDFENLIREIFEKEFVSSGGEVKVTQASRDGGVDAIAFDPDPIRGGKIVIQAKRYSNVVGVAAVRDLYGTTVNEGATKGILVTTADFGPDAYEFAKGKPLTLLNGSNLLHLLEKHGHRARIDLREAKQILNEQKN